MEHFWLRSEESRIKIAFVAIAVTMLCGRAWGQEITSGNAAYKGFTKGYCTYYAAVKFDELAPEPRHNWRGNAGAWLNNAQKKGWLTSTRINDAKKGALVIWGDGAFGHVGVVESVGSNSVEISEMNWGKIVDAEDAVTVNFGKVTHYTMPFSESVRAKKYTFIGYVFPRRFVGGDPPPPKENRSYEITIPANQMWFDTGIDLSGKSLLITYVSGSWSNGGKPARFSGRGCGNMAGADRIECSARQPCRKDRSRHFPCRQILQRLCRKRKAVSVNERHYGLRG